MDNKALLNLDQNTIQIYLEALINDLTTLIAIKSVAQPYKSGLYPYGAGCDSVLKAIAKIARHHGFDFTVSPENTYGYLDYGEGDRLFGILCHLDVVPPGDLSQWNVAPWQLQQKDGVLYGRGVLDDKGPALMQIYALKYLRDVVRFKPKQKIRIIFGLTEETDWASVEQYTAHELAPDDGYVPDGVWPIVFAEKTIITFDITGPGIKGLTLENWNNNVYNMVPDKVAININPDVYPRLVNEIKRLLDTDVIQTSPTACNIKGTAAHGSRPELGDSAIIKLASALKTAGVSSAALKFINENYGPKTFDLKNIFNNYSDDSGSVTSNLGLISINKQQQKLGIEVRVPVTLPLADIKNKINQYFVEHYPGFKVAFHKSVAPKYLPTESEKIQTLLAIYRDVTGDMQAMPVATGGGTYARQFENLVAFGAAFKFDAMHGPNEYIKVTDLKTALSIYIQTIYKLN